MDETPTRLMKKESRKGLKNLGNVSLAHLTPEQALFAAMNVKPPARKKAAPKPKK